MKGGRFNPGQAYVAFSRVKTLDGLHILNFNPIAIKASGDIKTEMERLTGNLLNFSAVIPAIYSPDSNTITVVLLNVRSISSKFPDIVQDATLISADVACITETWLRQSQTSPDIPNQ